MYKAFAHYQLYNTMLVQFQNNSKNLIYNIRHSGGLSDIWSGSAALPLLQDLEKWQIGQL